jgi:hypothetical protein
MAHRAVADIGVPPAQCVGETFFIRASVSADRTGRVPTAASEIADVGGQQRETELSGVQQEHAVVQSAKPAVGCVALEAADDAGKQRSASHYVNVRGEYPVRRHGPDEATYLRDGPRCATTIRVQGAHSVHQPLDGNRRVIDLPSPDISP